MSNVTQLTKIKTGLYALITFLFLVVVPVQAQECTTADNLAVTLNARHGDDVYLSNMYSGQVAINIVAVFNAVPPESFLDADGVLVFKHKVYTEVALLVFMKSDCLLESYMLPITELKKFLPNRA